MSGNIREYNQDNLISYRDKDNKGDIRASENVINFKRGNEIS